jgi:predicted nuclease of predicted toxin-antitoxin system
MIRLLADENISLDAVHVLREAGYEIIAVAEENRSAQDVDVLRMACESNRVLVTFDRDFGELIYRDLAPIPPGVIYLRIADHSPGAVASILLAFLGDPAVVVVGRFSVLTTDTVRQRSLAR